MDDTISRREAIRIASGYCHLANVAKELAKLPAVQPCDDAVSRQAAIDELYKMLHDCFWADDEELDAVITTLNELPPVQPGIIHCKECLHKIKNGNHYECDYWDFEDPKDDGFCSFAERRTDE